MTGRRLYDHYTDAAATLAENTRKWHMPNVPELLTAWADLTPSERTMWNRAAKQITSGRRR